MTDETMNKIHDELFESIRKLQKEGISKYNILSYLSMTNDTFLDDNLELKEGKKHMEDALFYVDFLKAELRLLATIIPGVNPNYNPRCEMCMKFTVD